MSSSNDVQQLEERLIVVLSANGDGKAFRQLVDWYDQRLLYFVRRILGETEGALDVLQAVWLIVHRKLHTLAAPEAFRVWLYRIAHDQAIDELRRKTRRPLLLDNATIVAVQDTDEADLVLENAELIHAALLRLSFDHRRVLTLRFLEDMTTQEIADVTGCTLGTVKSRLHYAKLALRQTVEELLHD